MSQSVGLIMIISGIFAFVALALKLLFQPFISEEQYIHHYFPSTELVLGIPILCGSVFFAGFGLYILRVLLKNKFLFLKNGTSDGTSL